jgi:hypothetical protein
MLWYKAWLETRWRLLSMVMSIAVLLPMPLLNPRHVSSWQIFRLTSPILCCLAAVFLAGAGVNTQNVYSAASGFHQSMHFTLSLPISRNRLFSVRAGLGAVLTGLFVLIIDAATLYSAPDHPSTMQATEFVVRTMICTMSVYALFAFLATFLDDMWRMNAGIVVGGIAWVLQITFPRAAGFGPLAGLSLFSNPLRSTMAWQPVITSAVAIAVLTWSSVLVLQRKEY